MKTAEKMVEMKDLELERSLRLVRASQEYDASYSVGLQASLLLIIMCASYGTNPSSFPQLMPDVLCGSLCTMSILYQMLRPQHLCESRR
jgi:hypothetical protein